jgi:hypothetical protein
VTGFFDRLNLRKRASIQEKIVLDCFGKNWRHAESSLPIGMAECIGDLA